MIEPPPPSEPPPPPDPATRLDAPAPAPPAPDQTPPLWGPGEALIGVAIGIAVLILGSIPILIIAGDSGVDATIGSQLLLELTFIGTALGVVTRAANVDLATAARHLGLRRPAGRWIGVTMAGFGAYFVVALLITAIGPDVEQEDVTNELGYDESALTAIIAGFLIVLAAPIAEEIFFRGFFFAGLRSRMPVVLAAVISGAFFGVIHLSTGNGWVALQLAAFGVILALVYHRTGTLWSSILLHGVNNALAFTLLVSS